MTLLVKNQLFVADGVDAQLKGMELSTTPLVLCRHAWWNMIHNARVQKMLGYLPCMAARIKLGHLWYLGALAHDATVRVKTTRPNCSMLLRKSWRITNATVS